MKNNKLSKFSKVLLFLSIVSLAISLFVPLWRIELNAPQYPEGLVLLIYTNKLGGNVDIINGLNHYIGMDTLHSEKFIEFTILPYVIAAFAVLALLVLFSNRKKGLYIWFAVFVLFGIISMVDFWRWEYNYGHNLNPNAAIIVPGMAYQPPLIGFKQLLNFGAYSVPDIGGWLFVLGGLFILVAVLFERKVFRNKNINAMLVTIIFSLTILSCNSISPSPININKDKCDDCKMSIADKKFACELITIKGRIYKFDDVACMRKYMRENVKNSYSKILVSHYTQEQDLINATNCFFVESGKIKSPMGGNAAAFISRDTAILYSNKYNGLVINWTQINKE